MDSRQLETNLAANAERLKTEFVSDMREELRHIANPAECGHVVSRHFSGIMIALYIFIGMFLMAAIGVIWLYTRH